MSDDWKEIEDVSQDCSYDNGWCGYCGKCAEHAQDLHRQEEYEENDFYSY